MTYCDKRPPSLADSLLPAYAANPYPLYHQLRSLSPVFWDVHLQRWVVTRYGDVLAILKDARFSAHVLDIDITAAPPELKMSLTRTAHILSHMMFLQDPPHHTRLRSLISRAFTPRMIEALRPYIQQQVHRLLDPVATKGRMDVLYDFAYLLPTTIIAYMLGVPLQDCKLFFQWASDLDELVDEYPKTQERSLVLLKSIATCVDYFHSIIAQRKHRPQDDLLQALIVAREQGDCLSEDELISTCILLLVAGLFTTTHLMSNGLYALLEHPDQLRLLRNEPALVPQAVVELLRYDSPVQETARVATTDVDMHGQRIAAGQYVIVSLGAANHDPEQFAHPDRLDILRTENRHLSFGHGIHFCIGASLARLEVEIALSTLLQRFSHFSVESAEWEEGRALRGLKQFSLKTG